MINLFKVFMPEEVTDSLSNILHSGQLAYGKYTQEFEAKLSKFVGNPNTLAVSGNSVYFALKLIDIKPEDEIIASPMACLATNQPVAYAGAKIVWADIDPASGSLNPDDVKRKITKNTKAIIHYHWSGYPGYIDEVNQLAKEKGIFVIEDASEAFGSEYKGNLIGNTQTDIVCYSFTPVRLPNTIDGGGLSIQDEKLYQKALLMRDYGIVRQKFRDELNEISEKCDIEIPADGCAMNNLNGYVGSLQMDHVPKLLNKQREQANIWNEKFSTQVIIKNLIRDEINPNFWTYTILTDQRDRMLQEYRSKAYYASKLHLRNDYYSVFSQSLADLKGVTEFANKQLSLPCGWWM